MSNVGYVVLHYQMIEETKHCVNSIKERHGTGRVRIVVVDNASPNHTGKELADFYSRDDEVTVKLLDRNVGFAKGHNSGIQVLRKDSNIEFCVLLNNDTELKNDNWDDIIKEKFEQYHYAVMGPDIVSLDGSHTNPSEKQDISIEGIRKMIEKKNREIFLYKSYIIPLFKIPVLWMAKKCHILSNEPRQQILYDMKNVQLQGSCLILSVRYFNHYPGLYDKTFLYFEEAILRYRCEEKKLLCMYSPDLLLLHKESASIKASFKNDRKRKLFYLENSKESCENFYRDIRK